MSYYLLTTTDNPYNPHTHWDEWYAWDIANYDTCGYLARIARVSPELSDADYDTAVNRAIDEIVEFNLLGVYTKVKVESSEED